MGKESPFLIDNEAHWFNQWRRLKNKRLGYIMYCEVRKLPFLKGKKLLPCVIAWLADLFLRHYSLWLKTNKKDKKKNANSANKKSMEIKRNQLKSERNSLKNISSSFTILSSSIFLYRLSKRMCNAHPLTDWWENCSSFLENYLTV